MRKVKVLGIGLAAVVLLGALFGLFWTLDFYFGQAQTQTNAQVAVSSNAAGREGLDRPGGVALRVYITDDDEFARGLREELCRQLVEGPQFSSVEIYRQASGTDANVLAVQVGNRHVRWSGVYSNAEVQIKLSYSTMGGVYYPESGTSIDFDAGKPALVVQGTYEVTDTTMGLMSLHGYQRELGKRTGAELARSLTTQLQEQSQRHPA